MSQSATLTGSWLQMETHFSLTFLTFLKTASNMKPFIINNHDGKSIIQVVLGTSLLIEVSTTGVMKLKSYPERIVSDVSFFVWHCYLVIFFAGDERRLIFPHGRHRRYLHTACGVFSPLPTKPFVIAENILPCFSWQHGIFLASAELCWNLLPLLQYPPHMLDCLLHILFLICALENAVVWLSMPHISRCDCR